MAATYSLPHMPDQDLDADYFNLFEAPNTGLALANVIPGEFLPPETAAGEAAAETGIAGGTTSAPSTFASIPTLADYLVNGYWTWAGDGAHHWASHTVTVNINGLNADEKVIAQAALNAWHEVANISFTFVASGANITYLHTGGGAVTGLTMTLATGL